MSELNSANEQRRADVKALVELERPIAEALARLAKYEFDYIGEPIRVRSEHVSKIAIEFLDGRISANELTAWANRLEANDDVQAEGKTAQETDEILEAIFDFANPELSGCSLEDTAKYVRSIMLRHKSVGESNKHS